jgi:type IV pilus assembly protein PilM
MAESPTSVVLNIGSQRIGMAVFEVTKNSGLLLKAYSSESIVADPALDASRISQTRVAIADLASRLKVGKTKARYAISGQAVFTRFVKLPPLQDDNIEQLVTFEAQQHVPFPINEVVWDYELIEGGGDQEVAIVAIKGDALDEINSAVNDSGLATAEVDVAPMALYNAFRASYGKPDEPILLIDIGAKTSNLLYIEGKRFFTRSIAIGGGSITAAIAKEYGISFNDAEHQKVANGLVALGGGHTGQLDEAVAALAMVIRNALTRLPAEIARTTNYYRSQHGGSAPRRVMLAGGGSNLPYTLEFFQEKLNLPVEYFNPLQTVAVGKGVDAAALQREAHLMGELVGLGLRAAGKSSINIDLVPAVVEQSRAADRRKPFLIAAAAVFLLGMTVWAVSRNIAAGNAADEARSMKESRDTLQPVVGEIEGLLRKQEETRKIADAYTGSEAAHSFWLDLLAEVRGAFASDAMWITDLEPLHGYNPLPPADFKGTNGRTVVKSDFPTAAYGSASVADIKVEEPQTGRPGGRNQPPPAAKTATANAIRITGLWRENPLAQNVVSERLKRLRENPGSFTFTVKGPDGKPVELRDEQILRVTSVAEGAELALPFVITLPLAREIPIK